MTVILMLIIMIFIAPVAYFFSFFLGKKGTFLLAITGMGVCFLISLYLFVNMFFYTSKTVVISLGT